MKPLCKTLTAALLLLCGVALHAQDGRPSLEHAMVAPEMVIKHRKELNLTEEQGQTIINFAKEAQAQVMDLQWSLAPEMEKLHEILMADKVDEGAAMAQLEVVTALEQRIKKTQLTLIIRVKNTLTKEQVDKIHALMAHAHGQGGGQGPGPGHPMMPHNP